MPVILGWFITFNFINIAWVFFRALNFDAALKVLNGMFMGVFVLPSSLESYLEGMKGWGIVFGHWSRLYGDENYMGFAVFAAFFIVLALPNSMEWQKKFKTNFFYMALTVLFFLSIFMLYRKSEFIYFNF